MNHDSQHLTPLITILKTEEGAPFFSLFFARASSAKKGSPSPLPSRISAQSRDGIGEGETLRRGRKDELRGARLYKRIHSSGRRCCTQRRRLFATAEKLVHKGMRTKGDLVRCCPPFPPPSLSDRLRRSDRDRRTNPPKDTYTRSTSTPLEHAPPPPAQPTRFRSFRLVLCSASSFLFFSFVSTKHEL